LARKCPKILPKSIDRERLRKICNRDVGASIERYRSPRVGVRSVATLLSVVTSDRMTTHQILPAVPLAVCALLVREDGFILGVSRRGKPEDMGLPGGKVETGESPEDAIVREVQEETGVVVTTLRKIFRGLCPGEVTYDSITYLAEFEGEPFSKEAGLSVKWIEWKDLLDPSNSFYDYNKRLFDHVSDGYALHTTSEE